MKIKIASPMREERMTINQFKGINISVDATQIDKEQSPDMLNLLPDDRGNLDKRLGWKRVFNTTLGASAINGIFEYRKSTGIIIVFAHGTKLYKFTDLTAGTYSQIYSGVANNKIKAFNWNDKLYLLDGSSYLVYDGTTVAAVTPYVPTITIGTPPAGGGTAYEERNLLTGSYKQQFSGDGVTAAYQLANYPLDTGSTVTATVNGSATTAFTVVLATGIVTFNGGSIPDSSAPNNVTLQATATVTGAADYINNCTFAYAWGGSNDTRIFMSGNSTYGNTDWFSANDDPTYFPENNFDEVGELSDSITGYSELYGTLIIHKQMSLYQRQWVEDVTGTIFYTTKLNSGVGNLAIDGIQVLENFPTTIDKKGIFLITSINDQNEKNVTHISDNIDKNQNLLSVEGFLEMGNLADYIAYEYNQQCWFFNPNNGIVWVYDYRYKNGEWFKLDNIFASCVLLYDDNLYFGDSKTGLIKVFKTKTELYAYNDDLGVNKEEINGYWQSKIFSFDYTTNYKIIHSVFYTIKPAAKTRAVLSSRSNKNGAWKIISTRYLSWMQYSTLTYSLLTYGGNLFPQTTSVKTKEKKVNYYQIQLQNNYDSESLGIIDVSTKFQFQGEV